MQPPGRRDAPSRPPRGCFSAARAARRLARAIPPRRGGTGALRRARRSWGGERFARQVVAGDAARGTRVHAGCGADARAPTAAARAARDARDAPRHIAARARLVEADEGAFTRMTNRTPTARSSGPRGARGDAPAASVGNHCTRAARHYARRARMHRLRLVDSSRRDGPRRNPIRIKRSATALPRGSR